jgi:hypothetical protein
MLSVVPMFIGNDLLNVYHLKQGGVQMDVFACPAVFDISPENFCLQLSSRSNATLDFGPQSTPGIMNELPVLFVKWHGYIKATRLELVTFEIQASGRFRLWLDERLQVDKAAEHSNGPISFSVNITSPNHLLFLRMECHGQFSDLSAVVSWRSKRMNQQVTLVRFVE